MGTINGVNFIWLKMSLSCLIYKIRYPTCVCLKKKIKRGKKVEKREGWGKNIFSGFYFKIVNLVTIEDFMQKIVYLSKKM